MQWCESCGYKQAKAGSTKCAACRTRGWRQKNPAKQAEQSEKDKLSKFGVDQSWYDQTFTEQHGVCAICEKPETTKQQGRVQRLSVDHDHKTGKPRGLLCAR